MQPLQASAAQPFVLVCWLVSLGLSIPCDAVVSVTHALDPPTHFAFASRTRGWRRGVCAERGLFPEVADVCHRSVREARHLSDARPADTQSDGGARGTKHP